MLLLKAAAATLGSVITNQRHAFVNKPKNWYVGETALISKNKVDCARNEKQIQFTTVITNIRELKPGEAERLWPGNEGRWRYIVECKDTRRLGSPFDLRDILRHSAERYRSIVTFGKISAQDERAIEPRLELR